MIFLITEIDYDNIDYNLIGVFSDGLSLLGSYLFAINYI